MWCTPVILAHKRWRKETGTGDQSELLSEILSQQNKRKEGKLCFQEISPLCKNLKEHTFQIFHLITLAFSL
jgi:hypothetical protein